MKTSLAILSCLLASWSVCPGQTAQNIGDTADGSRSVPLHLIKLYDEFDHLIRPGERPAMPFSTQRTCGKCHDYGIVRGGWHFNWADSGVAPGVGDARRDELIMAVTAIAGRAAVAC